MQKTGDVEKSPVLYSIKMYVYSLLFPNTEASKCLNQNQLAMSWRLCPSFLYNLFNMPKSSKNDGHGIYWVILWAEVVFLKMEYLWADVLFNFGGSWN